MKQWMVCFLPQLLGIESKPRTHLFAERAGIGVRLPERMGLIFHARSPARVTAISQCSTDRSYTPVDMSKKDAWTAITESHRQGQLSTS